MINYNLEDLQIFKEQFASNGTNDEDFIMFQTYLAITDYIITKITEEKITDVFIELDERQKKIISNRKIVREEIRKLQINEGAKNE